MNAPTTQEFRSGDPLKHAFMAANMVLLAIVGSRFDGDIPMATGFLLIVAVVSAWMAVRAWWFPYVRLEPTALVVFVGSRVSHCISLDQVEGISGGLNKTILKLRGGTTAEISHINFSTTSVRNEFVQALKMRIEPEAKKAQRTSD